MRNALLALIALLLTAAPTWARQDQGLDCKQCHVCAQPSKADPCLKQAACPRHVESTKLKADEGPDVVILDDLEDLYVPVRFQHRAHARMVAMDGGCETCHHYTPPNSDHPSCRECHAAGAHTESLKQTGLKGAYHRQCLGCHNEWDGETKCANCHEKKQGGRLGGEATGVCEHSNYAPIEMKELIVFSTSYAAGDVVPFHHRNHAEKYELNCSNCHKEQSCARCHTHGAESHPMGELQKVNLHDTCYQCHGKQNCTECHGRKATDLFDHASTGWPLQAYHSRLQCRACHGDANIYVAQDRTCSSCHAQGWGAGFDHAKVGAPLDDTHGELSCEDCHTSGMGQKPDCAGCHDDGRVYDRRRGFGQG